MYLCMCSCMYASNKVKGPPGYFILPSAPAKKITKRIPWFCKIPTVCWILR